MSDKERLEEIKAGLSHDYIHGNDFPISLGFIDLEWLIKQAEKADRPQNNLIEEMEKVDFLHEKLIETKKQNKRYREVIDSMRLHAHYPELIKQIYEALEESE